MAMNRIQFQNGLLQHQFMELYGTVNLLRSAELVTKSS